MNYQPFLDMHLLVSDELMKALPPVIQAIVLTILCTVLAVLAFIWLRKNV